MQDFFHTLLNPDHEDFEERERSEVSNAANLLQVGEFQILQLAYHDWYGEDLPEGQVDPIFTDYMLYNKVPHWARHYARNILALEARNELDDMDPAYHRYDHDYTTYVPGGKKKFITAVSLLCLFLFGAIGLSAAITAGKPGSVLPPYFTEKELKRSGANPLP